MKFQFSEIVEHPDADLILRTLEHCFREISLEVIRSGDQLTVYGIGPSFRTMNPKDKTVLQASSKQTVTVIQTEANFLASALMGDMPQDSVVRTKIVQAFRCMKTQLNLASPREDPPDTPISNPSRPIPTVPLATLAPEVSNSPSPEPMVAERASLGSTLPKRPTTESLPELSTIKPSQPVAVEPEYQLDSADDDFTAVVPAPLPSDPVSTTPETDSTVPLRSFMRMEARPRKSKRSVVLPVTVLAAAALLCAAYLSGYGDVITKIFTSNYTKLFTSKQVGQSAAPVIDEPEIEASSTPSQVTVEQPLLSAHESDETPTNTRPTDIKAWVEDWAAAMRTQDPENQISFYTNPVDRYFLRSHVTSSELLREKQSQIKNRDGLWQFKAENVVIERQTGSSAVVYLTKHFMAHPPSSSIGDQRVRSQLKLRLVNGSWKITSERTLG